MIVGYCFRFLLFIGLAFHPISASAGCVDLSPSLGPISLKLYDGTVNDSVSIQSYDQNLSEIVFLKLTTGEVFSFKISEIEEISSKRPVPSVSDRYPINAVRSGYVVTSSGQLIFDPTAPEPKVEVEFLNEKVEINKLTFRDGIFSDGDESSCRIFFNTSFNDVYSIEITFNNEGNLANFAIGVNSVEYNRPEPSFWDRLNPFSFGKGG